MKSKLKNVILENSSEKVFGCIHCQENRELCIDNISIMCDEIKKLFDMKNISIGIVNEINKEFNLDLKTVDSFAMSEFIENYLKIKLL